MKPITLFILLLCMLLSACAPSNPDSQPSYPNSYPSNSGQPVEENQPPILPANPDNPYAPQAGDKDLQTDKVYLDISEVQTISPFPPDYQVALRGSLPTPCHSLRVQIKPPDEQNNIYIEVYSVSDPNMVCTQVLQPFDVTVPLKNLIPVLYKVWLNGNKIAEIEG